MVTKTIDSFVMTQCKNLDAIPVDDIHLPYQDGSAPHELTIDDSTFQNDGSYCLLETCTFHAAGECGGQLFSTPGDLIFPSYSPWTIQAQYTV